MSRKTLLAVIAAATSCALVAVLAVALLVVDAPAATTSGPPATATASVGSGEPEPDVLGVVELQPDTVLLVHEATVGATRFDQGIVWIDVAADASTFRWIEGAGVVDGGRTTARADLLTTLPVGLHLVVSYDIDGVPASIYGTLGAAIATSTATISYPVVVYDAPGKGSTYTLSGSYDIPEDLEQVRVFISGQAISASS